MNQFPSESPFDLYALELFRLVAQEASFTRAATIAGLTQSAVTRQIQGMEERLEVSLFERTTRKVRLTTAGDFLLQRSGKLLANVDETLRELREGFALAPKSVRVGVSQAIGLAYLPGFFHAFQRRFPEVLITVASGNGETISQRVADGELDVGFLCPPKRIAKELEVTHRFSDGFTFIAPPDFKLPEKFDGRLPALRHLVAGERCLLISPGTTGTLVRDWIEEKQLDLHPAMELDSFDLIINLVSQGMGISLVPHRALPIYARSRPVKRIPSKTRLHRELIIVARKNRQRPSEITNFIESVLYG
ncbi:MAG: DNA-binding transcriptional LysR family regulator [Verrucomicrobiales bacterium]|jgi:DNA-binding transcriptional LysR family regulator